MKTNTCHELYGARPANHGSHLMSWRGGQSTIVACLTAAVLFLASICNARAQGCDDTRPDEICHPWTGNVDAFTYGNGVSQQLLGDPTFREGFRAFWTAKDGLTDGPTGWTGDWTLKLGTIKDNYTPYLANSYYNKNYTIHAWPDTAPYRSDGTYADAGKYWNFNEGLHENYTDAGSHTFPANHDGTWNPATDLMVHRIEANLETAGFGYGSDGKLNEIFLEHKNNLPAPDGVRDASGNNALVRTVWAKNGALYTYMNTQNELRNIAQSNSPIYKLDTWPHFYVEENFKKLIDLATLSIVQFSAKLRVWDVVGDTNASYGVGYTLRNKRTPTTVVFLGYSLYSGNGAYGPYFDTDQSGQLFFRGNPSDLGGALVPDNGTTIFEGGRTIGINLPELFQKAKNAAAAAAGEQRFLDDSEKESRRLAFLQTTVEDYYLAGVGIGWETVGWQQVSSQMSNLSLLGYPRVIFDSEVYQDDAYQAYYNFSWTWDGAAGMRRAHWAKYGAPDGWVASPTFDVKIYMKKWGALGPENVNGYNYMPQCYNNGTPNYGCGIAHYVMYGRSAGHYGR